MVDQTLRMNYLHHGTICSLFSPSLVRFFGNFVFNRKRNVVELEIKQDLTARGGLRYVGPLTVTIQELDGSFNHTFKIEENKTKFEITCHSKSRRNKKKKIPLVTGEEVDMDLSAMDADSPVLWLRVDPDMQLLRQVRKIVLPLFIHLCIHHFVVVCGDFNCCEPSCVYS